VRNSEACSKFKVAKIGLARRGRLRGPKCNLHFPGLSSWLAGVDACYVVPYRLADAMEAENIEL
jgi:hypothetical protein